MGRSIEVSGRSVVYLFYLSGLAIVPIVAYFFLWPLDNLASVAGAGLLVALVLVVIADYRYWKSGRLREHLEGAAERTLPYDITRRSSANLGQAAKERWLAAFGRDSDGDNDQ